MPKRARTNYRLGSFYSVVTASLLAAQEPLASPAAKNLSVFDFLAVTQLALLLSIPLLVFVSGSWPDFLALLSNRANIGKLTVLFLIGLSGLLLYNLGLSNAHPIIVAAILNLSPFWAALIAFIVSKKPIPISPVIFFGCLGTAFVGAMVVVWSQAPAGVEGLADSVKRSTWAYAIPVPALTALSGTLVGKWFAKYNACAAVSVNFAISALILVPGVLLIVIVNRQSLTANQIPPILLLIAATLVAAAVGRVLYQMSLRVTDNDNGFVTMFFLLAPGLAALISIPLSWAIPDLSFVFGPTFFLGLLLVAAPLLLFSLKAWRKTEASPPVALTSPVE